jgi:hypothetical protein
MANVGFDFNVLKNLYDRNRIKLSEVSHRIEKVAFDIVRFRDGDEAAKLWQVQSADDGDYIVALYSDPSESVEKTASAKEPSSWAVEVSADHKYVDVFYKRDHVTKLSLASLGIPSEEAHLLPKYLPKKLAESKSFSTKLIKSAGKEVQEYIVSQYPELG